MDQQKKGDTDIEKRHKDLVAARKRRRKEVRAQAKKQGHKLGHNNRKCKNCGTLRSAGFLKKCGETTAPVATA